MPKEQYILPDTNDLHVLQSELQRILDTIALRLNYIDADGDNIKFNFKKLIDLATGEIDSDAIRKDQAFLLVNLAAVILGTSKQINITDNGNETITLSTPQNIDTDADVTFDSITLDDLTALRMISTDANKKLISIANLASWIAGTANEIEITDDGDGTITIGIPTSPTLDGTNFTGIPDSALDEDYVNSDGTVPMTANWGVGGFLLSNLLLSLKAGTAAAGTAPLKFTAGTALTTPEAGTIEFHDDRFYITNVSRRRAIDRTNDVVIETTEVANTTTETTIYTGYIEASGLKVGNILKLNASGSLSNNSASDDITIRIYLGVDEVLSFSPAIGNISDAHWHIQGNMTVRTVGAAGTMAYHLDAIVDDHETLITGLGNVDTTIAEDFTVTVEWDNAKADNTIEIYQGYTEWKG